MNEEIHKLAFNSGAYIRHHTAGNDHTRTCALYTFTGDELKAFYDAAVEKGREHVPDVRKLIPEECLVMPIEPSTEMLLAAWLDAGLQIDTDAKLVRAWKSMMLCYLDSLPPDAPIPTIDEMRMLLEVPPPAPLTASKETVEG